MYTFCESPKGKAINSIGVGDLEMDPDGRSSPVEKCRGVEGNRGGWEEIFQYKLRLRDVKVHGVFRECLMKY